MLARVLRHGIMEGGPSDAGPGSRAAIRPLPQYDGRHYCADDWHAIMLSLATGGASTFSHEDAVELRLPASMEFTLDRHPWLRSKDL
jgi:hypothetical protein